MSKENKSNISKILNGKCWRRKWQLTSVLSGKSYGWKSLTVYSPCVCKKCQHNLVTNKQQNDSNLTEKWSNCGCALKAEPTKIADGYREKGCKAWVTKRQGVSLYSMSWETLKEELMLGGRVMMILVIAVLSMKDSVTNMNMPCTELCMSEKQAKDLG